MLAVITKNWSDRPSSILGVRILFCLSNLYGYVRVPVRGHSSVCLCAIIHVSRPFTSFFLIYYLVIVFLCEYVLCVRFLTDRKSTDERAMFG
jgi:hypothetical protein